MYKVIVSQMEESTLNHLIVVFKTNPKPFHVEVNMKYEHVAHPLLGLFGLNGNANSSFTTRCRFWSGKIAVSSVTAVHKAALHSQTLLYQPLQA